MSPTALASLFFICQALSCVIHTYLIKSNDFFFYLKNKTKTSEGNSILIFRQGEVLGCDVVQNSTGNTGVRKNWSEINNWYGLFSLNLLFFSILCPIFWPIPLIMSWNRTKVVGLWRIGWGRLRERNETPAVLLLLINTQFVRLCVHTHTHTHYRQMWAQRTNGVSYSLMPLH